MPQVEILVPWDAPADVDTVVNHLRALDLASNIATAKSGRVDQIKFECDDPSSIAVKLGIVATGLTIRAVPD